MNQICKYQFFGEGEALLCNRGRKNADQVWDIYTPNYQDDFYGQCACISPEAFHTQIFGR